MGLFWDLYQHSQISEQDTRTSTLEGRVERLERELRDTRMLLSKTLKILEEHVGKDIDGDGKTG